MRLANFVILMVILAGFSAAFLVSSLLMCNAVEETQQHAQQTIANIHKMYEKSLQALEAKYQLVESD